MKKTRYLSLLLTLFLLSGLLTTPALAASTATATSMTLEDVQGQVTVRNAKAKKVTLREGARLYKGYSVTTEKGYAWIGLDDTKSIKLDWDTQVTLKKSGKKLEVLLESGKLFFNVSQPLKKDESLSIRTSNMCTGIRGTSGILETSKTLFQPSGEPGAGGAEGAGAATAGSPGGQVVIVTTITMLDGAVQVTGSVPEDPVKLETSVVEAGWVGRITETQVTQDAPQEVEKTLTPVPVQQALESAPFAAVEVAKDPELQTRVEETAARQVEEGTVELPSPDTPLGELLKDVLGQADVLLQRQEQQAQEKREAVQQRVEEQKQVQETVGQTEGTAGTGQVFDAPAADTGASAPAPSTPASCTVSYYRPVTVSVDGGLETSYELFAQQTVTCNTPAAEPMLQPTASGVWVEPHRLTEDVADPADVKYDFSAAVTADLILYWVNTSGG